MNTERILSAVHKGRWNSRKRKMLIDLKCGKNNYGWEQQENFSREDWDTYLELEREGRIETYDYVTMNHGVSYCVSSTSLSLKFRRD